MAKKIGIDFGGTSLRAGTIDPNINNGDVQDYRDYTPGPRNWDDFVAILSQYKGDVESTHGVSVEGYGIAIAGPIKDHAIVIKGPNLPWLDGRNVRQELQAALGKRKVIISNDMEAAAEGERARGILQGIKWAIFDTIGTGWGGVQILNDEIVAGEPGHVNVSFSLPYVCGCGNVGCNEALYSGSAMERRIRQHLLDQNIVFPSDLKVWEYFNKEFGTGTSWAVSLLEEWAEGVGRAWANVLNRNRNLEMIVYMGTTAESLIPIPRAKDKIRATIRRICMFPEHREIRIEEAREKYRSIYGAVIVYDLHT